MKYYNQIMNKYEKSLEYMLNKHSKVMQIRFDMHYPNDNSIKPDKKHIYQFNTNLSRYFNRQKINGSHKIDLKKVWVEEKRNSQNPHYHYVALINGNAKRSMYSILSKAEDIWKRIINHELTGLINYCDKTYDGSKQDNGIIMDRNKQNYQNNIDKCKKQALYLAKKDSKDKKPRGAWMVGSSRINND